MIASPARVIASALVDLGLVKWPGVRKDSGREPLPAEHSWVFVNGRGADYERAVLVRDQAGLVGNRDMNGGGYHAKPGVALTIRDSDPQRGWATTAAVFNALSKRVLDLTTEVPLDNGSEESRTVQSVTVTTPPTHLGEEPNTRRHNWSIHTRVSFPDGEIYG